MSPVSPVFNIGVTVSIGHKYAFRVVSFINIHQYNSIQCNLLF